MTQSPARRLSIRLSIMVTTAIMLFLAAVPAQAVEHLAKPTRYRGRTSGFAIMPVWLIILIAVLVIVSTVIAKRRAAAKTN